MQLAESKVKVAYFNPRSNSPLPSRWHFLPAQDRLRINGPLEPAYRLPNTLSVSIKGLSASHALGVLRDQLAASAGESVRRSEEGTLHL